MSLQFRSQGRFTESDRRFTHSYTAGSRKVTGRFTLSDQGEGCRAPLPHKAALRYAQHRVTTGSGATPPPWPTSDSVPLTHPDVDTGAHRGSHGMARFTRLTVRCRASDAPPHDQEATHTGQARCHRDCDQGTDAEHPSTHGQHRSHHTRLTVDGTHKIESRKGQQPDTRKRAGPKHTLLNSQSTTARPASAEHRNGPTAAKMITGDPEITKGSAEHYPRNRPGPAAGGGHPPARPDRPSRRTPPAAAPTPHAARSCRTRATERSDRWPPPACA